MTLDEADGVTTMTTLVKRTTKEIRDAIIESGMEGGMQVSYNRLEDLVRQAAEYSKVSKKSRTTTRLRGDARLSSRTKVSSDPCSPTTSRRSCGPSS